jgi:hypothetical protein
MRTRAGTKREAASRGWCEPGTRRFGDITFELREEAGAFGASVRSRRSARRHGPNEWPDFRQAGWYRGSLPSRWRSS